MLRFRLFGFRVHVSPTFLILGLFLLDETLGLEGVVAFVAAAFVSIIVHELGHAFAVRGAGGEVYQITLHALGGATTWTDPRGRITWGRRIGIAAAGAGLGFVVAGLVFALVRLGFFGETTRLLIPTPFRVFLGNAAVEGLWGVFFLGAFIWVTMAWGLINWLPIGGLDGWHILSELMEKWLPRNGRMAAGVIGVLVAAGVGWFLFQRGLRFAPIILLLFSLQALAGSRPRRAAPIPPDAEPPR
jgi:stage IV sporulation protein FB